MDDDNVKERQLLLSVYNDLYCPGFRSATDPGYAFKEFTTLDLTIADVSHYVLRVLCCVGTCDWMMMLSFLRSGVMNENNETERK